MQSPSAYTAGADTRQLHAMESRRMWTVVFGSLFGTALETYDLYLYGTAAALIFAPLFFPGQDAAVARLLSLSTFAISFLSRPVGSVVLGHFGDRIGRKKLLYLTLITMGLSTVAIGFLPTYATAGFWAPLLLCFLRFVQGFAFAGEYSGAVLMLLEHAPAEKRGFYAGLNNVGPVFGFVLSSGLLLAVSIALSPAQFYSWGWRVPFVASAVLLLIGVYVRSRVSESPVFESAAQKRSESTAADKAPLARVFSQYPRELILVSGAVICHFATFYLFTVFSLSYGQRELKLSNALVLVVVMIAICTHLVAVPLSAALSDQIGRKKGMLIGLAVIALSAFPFWYLFSTGNFFLMVIGSCMIMTGYGLVYGPAPSFTGEAFGPSARFTGFAIATNVGGIIGGGFAPIVGAYLLDRYHSPYPIAAYIALTAVVSAVCVFFSRETKSSDILADR